MTTFDAKIYQFIQDPIATLGLGYDTIVFDRRKDMLSSWQRLKIELLIEPDKLNYFYIDEGAEKEWQYEPVIISKADPLLPELRQGVVRVYDVRQEMVMTVDELKSRYLFGLDQALTSDEGVPLPDSVYAFYISAAIDSFERKTDLYLLPTKVEGEEHDWVRTDVTQYFSFYLDHYPVISVDNMQVRLRGVEWRDINMDWIRSWNDKGHVNLVADMGTNMFPVFQNNFTHYWRYMPLAWKFDYIAGFPLGKIPYNIVDVVGKEASMGPLNIGGDLLVGAGIAYQSLTMDGLSQMINTTSSATNAGLGARILQYRKDVEDQYKLIIAYYKGVRTRFA